MASGASKQRLPDHYPLVTARGTIPVERLSERGLYSQARYQSRYAYLDYEPSDTIPADYHIDDYAPPRAEPRYVARDLSREAGASPARPIQTDTVRGDLIVPLRLADGPATVPRQVQPLRIQISAQISD